MRIATSIAASLFGGAAGLVAGFFGDRQLLGILAGVIAGGIVGFVFSLASRSESDPRVATESFSPAGFLGGIAGSVVANAGWIGGLISCAAGWVLGLLAPALFIAFAVPQRAHRTLRTSTTQPSTEEEGDQALGDRRSTSVVENNLALAIKAVNEMAERSNERRPTEGSITDKDKEKFGADLVDFVRRLARSAVLLGYGIQVAPVTASDGEVFGDELIDLMRRAARDAAAAAERGQISTGDDNKVDEHDAEAFGSDVIDCAWRVVFDELSRLQQRPEHEQIRFGEPSTLEMMGLGSWPEERSQDAAPNEKRRALAFDASLEVTCGWCKGTFLLGEVKTWRHGNTYLCPHCNQLCNGW